MRETIRTRLQNAIQCWVGAHHIPPTSAVEDVGAVCVGGMCTRCFKVKVGSFICNYWDESQTVEINGVIQLRGVNPILEFGNYCVMNLEALEEIAAEKRKKLKKSWEKSK